MSDPVAPLGNATFTGTAAVREIGPLGMITLRAKPDVPGLADAIQAASGSPVPGQRAILRRGDRRAAWMSPDEYLLIMPRAEVADMLGKISATLGTAHHLAADVSDARSVFRIEGAGADAVIARLCPVDLPRLPEGEIRRTRVAQVACALWREDGGITLVAFRSVARYVFDILANAAR
jgi:sarcosine oxidase subunit gamma